MGQRTDRPSKPVVALLGCSVMLLAGFKPVTVVNVDFARKDAAACDDYVDNESIKLGKHDVDSVSWKLKNKCGAPIMVTFEWNSGIPVSACVTLPNERPFAIDQPFELIKTTQIRCTVAETAAVSKIYSYHIRNKFKRAKRPSPSPWPTRPSFKSHELDIGIDP